MRCLCYAATATALYASCRAVLEKGGRWWGAAGLLVALPLVAVLGWGDPWVLLVVAGLAAALALSIHQWRCAMSFDATAGHPGDGLGSAPRALRWLLPGVTLVLSVLAVGQVAWFVPRCVWAVQRFGRWFCSEVHADLYESDLYEALQTAQCHHMACYGNLGPLPGAVSRNLSLRRVPDLMVLKHDDNQRLTTHA